jgi:hypothetical protein
VSNLFDLVLLSLLRVISMRTTPPWGIVRELRVKAEEETDFSFGCPPSDRLLKDRLRFGVVNLDKPRGPTSHEVVAWTKKILEVGRAGHGGTLEDLPRRSQCDRCSSDSS